MKDVKGNFFIIVASCALLLSFSCSKTSAPKCDDEKVKESVIKIARKEILDYETKKIDSQIKSSEQSISELSGHCESYGKNLMSSYAGASSHVLEQVNAKIKEVCDNDAEKLSESKNYLEGLKIEKGKALTAINSLNIGVKDVRTTSVDEKTGKQVCECNMTVTGEGGTKSNAITYTSELSDGGKNFYVNITSGL